MDHLRFSILFCYRVPGYAGNSQSEMQILARLVDVVATSQIGYLYLQTLTSATFSLQLKPLVCIISLKLLKIMKRRREKSFDTRYGFVFNIAPHFNMYHYYVLTVSAECTGNPCGCIFIRRYTLALDSDRNHLAYRLSSNAPILP